MNFLSFGWGTRFENEVTDKVYEIVVYALFSSLIEALGVKVKIDLKIYRILIC